MVHDYDNPNTCYAIGDCFSAMLGTAATVRQPSAGVFESISAIAKTGLTGTANMYEGTNLVELISGAIVLSGTVQDATRGMAMNVYNTAIKIGNTVYFKKDTTSDRFVIMGVQVEA